MSRQPETEVNEFTVAPMVSPTEGFPHHEWLIEFANLPQNLEKFASDLDKRLTELNVYYKDLISGSILQPLKISVLQPNTFIQYMKNEGKLGGQNKVPRLSNDRNMAEKLLSV